MHHSLTFLLKYWRQVVVGVPADMAFVVTSCSDLLEDVEVEVEQVSPNFIIAGYFKVPTLSPFPMSRLTPLDTDNHEPAAALQRIFPSQGHSTLCRPASCTRCSLQEPEGLAACPADEARLGAARRNFRVCDAAGLRQRESLRWSCRIAWRARVASLLQLRPPPVCLRVCAQ